MDDAPTTPERVQRRNQHRAGAADSQSPGPLLAGAFALSGYACAGMAAAVIVAAARSPDRPRPQGLARGRAAGRPAAHDRARRARAGARARPARTRRPHARLRPPGRTSTGSNIARVVAVQLGLDTVPGTTVNRFCASSLQTTRMAFHAIRAGEGDVFISAGVECVSRYSRRQRATAWQRGRATTRSSRRRRRAPSASRRRTCRLGRPARGRPPARRLHRDGPDGRERRRPARRQPRGAGRVRRPQPAAARSRRSRTASSSARSRR